MLRGLLGGGGGHRDSRVPLEPPLSVLGQRLLMAGNQDSPGLPFPVHLLILG